MGGGVWAGLVRGGGRVMARLCEQGRKCQGHVSVAAVVDAALIVAGVKIAVPLRAAGAAPAVLAAVAAALAAGSQAADASAQAGVAAGGAAAQASSPDLCPPVRPQLHRCCV